MKVWRSVGEDEVGYHLMSAGDEAFPPSHLIDLSAQGMDIVEITPAAWDVIRVVGEAVADHPGGPTKEDGVWYWVDK